MMINWWLVVRQVIMYVAWFVGVGTFLMAWEFIKAGLRSYGAIPVAVCPFALVGIILGLLAAGLASPHD